MKFVLLYKHVDEDEEPWLEDYEKSRRDLTAQIPVDCSKFSNKRVVDLWCRGIIKYFNDTEVNPKPRYREYVGSRLVDESQGGPDHRWGKTNLMTQADTAGYFDAYKCDGCGITGKRRGLGSHIIPDSKYRYAKIYQRCDTTKAHLAKKAKK